MTIGAILTCYNRREKTLECLNALFAQQLPAGYQIVVYLADDSSSDGTAHAVKARFPSVHILSGNGSLYWNGGMQMAFEAALAVEHDYYLWVNDDTLLNPDAVAKLLRTHDELQTQEKMDVIVAGTTLSQKDGKPTYGGVSRLKRWRRTHFNLHEPANTPKQCETINGNCVLIPRAIADRIGNLDEAFVHGMGDYDYGLRARTAGYSCFIAPGFAGICERNPVDGTFRDERLHAGARIKVMFSPKGLPPKEWFVFCRRHAGWMWPLFFIRPYILCFMPAMICGRLGRQLRREV